MEQPKKPGASRDIADLKARLGLLKGPTAAGGGQAPGAAPFTGTPAQGAPAFPGTPPTPPGAAPFGGRPVPSGPAFVAPAPAHDPYASMKPPAGRRFDLRPVDDGAPAVNVRARGGKSGLIIALVVMAVGGFLGYGFGEGAGGRRVHNQVNGAARQIKGDLQEIHKTATQIGTAVAMSQQRLAAARMDALSYDPQLIEDLEKVKLDPRPDTSRVFRVNYYQLDDLSVDRLMSYYYDTIVLYGEVERHIKRTHNDQEILKSFAEKETIRSAGAYGVVFDQRGKVVLGSLVEMGAPVCKNGSNECPVEDIQGFQIRSNTGASWSNRKIGPKPAGDTVVPLDKTPLLEAVMAGSPDQVRMEQYKERYRNIRLLLARIAGGQKQLMDAIDKASSREDLFTF